MTVREWASAMNRMDDWQMEITEDMLREGFALFDKDNSGFLTPDELVGILTRPGGGSAMSEADAKAFVEKHDKNKDGKLSIDEFVRAIAADRKSVLR